MARLFCFMSIFMVFFTATSQFSASRLKVTAQTNKSTGIFMSIDGGKYTLNFTEAVAACSFSNVTIATKAQMEEAVQHGSETCKFGWVAEKIAVIPRIQPDKNCGKGKTGLVQWNAPVHQRFAVFCFNTSALIDWNQTLKPTAGPQSARSSTSSEASFPTSTSAPATLKSPTRSQPSENKPATPQPTKQTTSAAITETTDLILSSISSSPGEYMTSHVPAPPHGLIPTIPTRITFGFSSSTQSSTSSLSSNLGSQPSVSSAKPSSDVAHIILISLSIVSSLLTTTTAWWCYKSNIFSQCVRRHKDDIETEMWRNTHSEMELNSEDGAENEHDEESSMKYSSDITSCVNPCTETNSSK